MHQAFLKLFTPPTFDDDEKNRLAKFLHIVILTIIGVVLASGIITWGRGNFASTIAAGTLLIPMALAYLANRAGQTKLASYIILFGAIIVITLILAVGQGIHDIGIINYGIILILAGYLLRNRGIFIISLALILSATFLVFGEFYGWLPVQNAPEKFAPELSDAILVSLFIVVGAVAIYLLSHTLQASVVKAKTAELRWRSLVNSIPDVVAILDRKGIIQWINHPSYEIPDFQIGKPIFDALSGTEKTFSQSDLDVVLAGNTFSIEGQFVTQDRKTCWFSMSIGPIYQSNGSISDLIAVIRNIQTIKETEAELLQNREELRAQTRYLETLQEINRAISTLRDLPGTLRLVLEQMRATLPLDGFVVALYDQESNMLSFPLVYDDGQIYQEQPSPLYPQSVIADAIYSRTTCILNRTEQQIQNPSIPWQKRLGSKKVSASVLTAPMIVHNRVIGALSAHSYSRNAYHNEHVLLLSGAANQIAIAIENARLYETSRARAEQLTALNEIGRSISTLQDLNGVLESTYRLLGGILQIDVFYIALYDSESQSISYPIVIDSGERWIEEPTPLIPEAQLTKTILNGEAYLVNRSAAEVANRQANMAMQNTLGNPSKVSASFMMAPLQFGRKILGAISAQSYNLNAYTSEDLELLTGVATQVAIAIENARLYSALQKELKERKRAETEVRKLNADLESRVRQRTKELEAANKELGSFTYTVSHDLRAPIRGINGLSHIIIEEFEKDLPEKVIEYIQRIQSNARQMGRLIDELLAFTHLGRQSLHPIQLDMAALSHSVIHELIKNENRQIDFSVQTLPTAYGDYVLVRQALTNLLANAIKFTSKTEHPRIEIGSLQQHNETVYFIRDNGVGFDMAYAGKLFGVFERLHRPDEFEGIGVGLAIVERIIVKHGGRIWAEGKVNQGATFFFTLPPSKEQT